VGNLSCTKECSHCGTVFTLVRSWQLFCSESCSKKFKYLRHKEEGRTKYYQYKADLKRLYGLSIEDYDAKVKQQDSCCAICGRSSLLFTGRKKRLCVDHCHTTGKVRGLLCEPCNTLLGMARDDMSVLSSAINYLRDYNYE
jgi:adenine-specific DNA methylase